MVWRQKDTPEYELVGLAVTMCKVGPQEAFDDWDFNPPDVKKGAFYDIPEDHQT